MTTTTNAGNLRQYKSRLSLIVEQILAFASSNNLVKDTQKFFDDFKNKQKRYKVMFFDM